MLPFGTVTQTVLSTIDVDERDVRVTLHIVHDGVEFVGRLWFAETEWTNSGIPDRGLLPGRTEGEVVALARRLRPDELLQRFRRANAEKRRFHGLRRLTTEILSKIRYLNQVAVSMRSGLLDREAARQEMQLTENQLIELVRQASQLSGIEG
ncbi:MAG: hypothetical protein IT353_12620 [Gemmatimonadaceae bacterium]|nr:hypothetical protein [Gemmatimonadaceae bacterium]